jgi:hypothetical protein
MRVALEDVPPTMRQLILEQTKRGAVAGEILGGSSCAVVVRTHSRAENDLFNLK